MALRLPEAPPSPASAPALAPRPPPLKPAPLLPSLVQQSRAPTRGMPPNQPPGNSPGVSTATAGLPRPPSRPAARLTIRRAPIGFGTGSASQSARAHAPLAHGASSLGHRGLREASRASVNSSGPCIWVLELLWTRSASLRFRPLFPTSCNIWETPNLVPGPEQSLNDGRCYYLLQLGTGARKAMET